MGNPVTFLEGRTLQCHLFAEAGPKRYGIVLYSHHPCRLLRMTKADSWMAQKAADKLWHPGRGKSTAQRLVATWLLHHPSSFKEEQSDTRALLQPGAELHIRTNQVQQCLSAATSSRPTHTSLPPPTPQGKAFPDLATRFASPPLTRFYKNLLFLLSVSDFFSSRALFHHSGRTRGILSPNPSSAFPFQQQSHTTDWHSPVPSPHGAWPSGAALGHEVEEITTRFRT